MKTPHFVKSFSALPCAAHSEQRHFLKSFFELQCAARGGGDEFSMVWKTFFHSVENLRKSFPQSGDTDKSRESDLFRFSCG
ncbi:MAG TPA: hypothetical protein PLT37_03750, partial [Kiritimatiellia bacterium]|nr:hypothetical protein [Kiritimatiellia bacterium]HQG74247.1 hypothetical protein [Kiritimatiellia bacterium]